MGFDPALLRKVMGLFATGVTIITTRDQEGKPYGLTANAVTSLSLDPPLLLICVDRKAETFPHFFDSKIFVLNILAEDQEALSRRFATTGGEKFAGVACRPRTPRHPDPRRDARAHRVPHHGDARGRRPRDPHRRGAARRGVRRASAALLPRQVPSPGRASDLAFGAIPHALWYCRGVETG
jgi:hypothetical protein